MFFTLSTLTSKHILADSETANESFLYSYSEFCNFTRVLLKDSEHYNTAEKQEFNRLVQEELNFFENNNLKSPTCTTHKQYLDFLERIHEEIKDVSQLTNDFFFSPWESIIRLEKQALRTYSNVAKEKAKRNVKIGLVSLYMNIESCFKETQRDFLRLELSAKDTDVVNAFKLYLRARFVTPLYNYYLNYNEREKANKILNVLEIWPPDS
ncbi:hypothetical protein CDIK_1818 [Cucumispora dikerogammari]|nr:hypothetical protein CDIK_1818 [Cucumispora dikerogammari]